MTVKLVFDSRKIKLVGSQWVLPEILSKTSQAVVDEFSEEVEEVIDALAGPSFRTG